MSYQDVYLFNFWFVVYIYILQKRISRLASIESGDQSTFFGSDRDSMSFDNEIQSKQDNGVSDEEAEIVDLMNRIELMKKERSDLWLQEFKEWMDPATLNVDCRKSTGEISSAYNPENMINNERYHPGETSRVIAESIQASGDDSSINNLESDNSFADTSVSLSAQSYLNHIGEEGSRFFLPHLGGDSLPVIKSLSSNQVHLKSSNRHMYTSDKSLQVDSFTRDSKLMEEHIIRPNTTIDDIVESHSLSVVPGSPPHYRVDILHRRQNLEEEFLQLSAESISVASSDSNTSYSEDDSTDFASRIPQMDQSLIGNFSERSTDDYSCLSYLDLARYDTGNKLSPPVQNGGHASIIHEKENSGYDEIGEPGSTSQFYESTTAGVGNVDMLHFVKHKADWLKKKRFRKPKRRIISLSDESKEDIKLEDSCKSNGNLDCCANSTKDKGGYNTNFSKSVGETRTLNVAKDACMAVDSGDILSLRRLLCMEPDDQVMSSFLSMLTKSGVQDSWRQFLQCECLLEKKSDWTER